MGQAKKRLPQHEMETHITWDAANRTATIDTVDPRVLAKLEKLNQEFPEVYRLVREDPLYGTQWYQVPSKLIRFARPAKPLTPEQIERNRENLLRAKEKRQEGQDE